SARCSAWPVTIHGVLPSQIRTRESGISSARRRNSGGGSNGQPAARGMGNSAIFAASVVIVSDIVLLDTGTWSRSDTNGLGGTGRGGGLDVGGRLVRWRGVEQHHHSVLVALVEHVRSRDDAMPGRHALVLVDLNIHDQTPRACRPFG